VVNVKRPAILFLGFPAMLTAIAIAFSGQLSLLSPVCAAIIITSAFPMYAIFA
jgi:hypothetical protein